MEKDEEIIVLVGDTYGQQLSLQVIGETYTNDEEDRGWIVNSSGSIYFLSPGINKLTMKESGQLFVMYTAMLNDDRAKPVNIHIPSGSGKVTGFFDLKDHKTDQKYAQLLAAANHKYFVFVVIRSCFISILKNYGVLFPIEYFPPLTCGMILLAGNRN